MDTVVNQALYGIYDEVATCYINTFVCNNDAAAKRVFIDSINSTNHPLRKLYKDIKLYKICDINLQTGVVKQCNETWPTEFLLSGESVYKEIPTDIELFVYELAKADYKKLLDKQVNAKYKPMSIDEVIPDGSN